MAVIPLLDVCPDDHAIQDVGIRCAMPHCRRFILFSPYVYGERRITTFIQTTLLVLSTIVVLVLFRRADQIWPMYLFVTLAIVCLYATIFSRGGALAGAATALTTVALAWLAWEVATTVVAVRVTLDGVPEPVRRWLPVIVWVLLTAYIFYLGSRRNLFAIKVAGSYFMAAGTLTFGFWGMWIIALENHMVTTGTFQTAVWLALSVPLLSITFLFGPPARQTRRTQDSWLNLVAVCLVLTATYLIWLDQVADAVAFVLGRFLPQALGLPALETMTNAISLGWLGDIEWRALLMSVLLLVAVALMAVHSAMEVAFQAGQARPPGLRPDEISTLHLPRRFGRTPTATASTTTTNSAESPAETRSPSPDDAPSPDEDGVAGNTSRSGNHGSHRRARGSSIRTLRSTASRAASDTSYVGTFIAQTGVTFLANVAGTVRRAFGLVFLVVAFSVLSMLVVLVLAAFHEYQVHGPFVAPVALWGMALTVLVSVIVLCGVAFEFAPSRDRRVTVGRPLVEAGTASLVGGVFYILISLVSLGLLPLVWLGLPASVQAGAVLVPGKVYFVNLTVVLGTLAVLAGLYAAGQTRLFGRQQSTKDRVVSVCAGTVLVAVVGLAVSFGYGPLQSAAKFASTPRDSSVHDGSAETYLLSFVPPSIAPTCTRDHLTLDGYRAGLSCHLGSTDIYYYLSGTPEQLKHWYDATVSARSIPRLTGHCSQTSTGEGVYTQGPASGNLACYTDRGGSWLIWTLDGSSVLGLARCTDGPGALYTAWSSGAWGPLPPDDSSTLVTPTVPR